MKTGVMSNKNKGKKFYSLEETVKLVTGGEVSSEIIDVEQNVGECNELNSD